MPSHIHAFFINDVKYLVSLTTPDELVDLTKTTNTALIYNTISQSIHYLHDYHQYTQLYNTKVPRRQALEEYTKKNNCIIPKDIFRLIENFITVPFNFLPTEGKHPLYSTFSKHHSFWYIFSPNILHTWGADIETETYCTINGHRIYFETSRNFIPLCINDIGGILFDCNKKVCNNQYDLKYVAIL